MRRSLPIVLALFLLIPQASAATGYQSTSDQCAVLLDALRTPLCVVEQAGTLDLVCDAGDCTLTVAHWTRGTSYVTGYHQLVSSVHVSADGYSYSGPLCSVRDLGQNYACELTETITFETTDPCSVDVVLISAVQDGILFTYGATTVAAWSAC